MMTTKAVNSEIAPEYKTQHTSVDEDAIVAQAIEILESRMKKVIFTVDSPAPIKQYLSTKLCQLEHEVFGIVYLDNRHQAFAVEELFRGTIDGASVYPREVVKSALSKNAAAIIFYHNHPSGKTAPSNADETITKRLKSALDLVDVRVLDHIIVGGVNNTYSFAEHGKI